MISWRYKDRDKMKYIKKGVFHDTKHTQYVRTHTLYVLFIPVFSYERCGE